MKLYLKLRNNISLEGDIQLAKREIKHLFSEVEDVLISNLDIIPEFVDEKSRTSNIRKGEIIGYVVSGAKVSITRLVKLLSFIQEIWCNINEVETSAFSVSTGNATCIIPMMAMSEFLSFMPILSENSTTEIINCLANVGTPNRNALKSISRVNTSSPHVHSFHKYKAKFYPKISYGG